MNTRAYYYEGLQFEASDFEPRHRHRYLIEVKTHLERLRSRIRHAVRVRQERQQLAGLNEHLLKDIGISRDLILKEYQQRYLS